MCDELPVCPVFAEVVRRWGVALLDFVACVDPLWSCAKHGVASITTVKTNVPARMRLSQSVFCFMNSPLTAENASRAIEPVGRQAWQNDP